MSTSVRRNGKGDIVRSATARGGTSSSIGASVGVAAVGKIEIPGYAASQGDVMAADDAARKSYETPDATYTSVATGGVVRRDANGNWIE